MIQFFISSLRGLFVIFIFVFGNYQNSFSWGPAFVAFGRSCKLLDQNFVSFNLENIHIKESKKQVFTLSIEFRTKFV